jgi:uncharacterized protein YjdB
MKKYRVFFGLFLLATAVCLLTCENVGYADVVKTVQDKVKQSEPTVLTLGGDEDEEGAAQTPPGSGPTKGNDQPEEPEVETEDLPHIGGGEGEYEGVKVNSITLNETAITLQTINATFQLTAEVDPPEASVTWFSRNSSMVSVDQTGLVTRLGSLSGSSSSVLTEIVAKTGGKSAVCTVNRR